MTHGRFVRDWLPDPVLYYAEAGVQLIGRGSWRSALCRFHDDHYPSLRINIATGAFRCMSCDAHGGDVLAFERLRTGAPFEEACRVLGAWETAR
jgi:DNA primase